MTPDEVRTIDDPVDRAAAATKAIADLQAELVAIRRDAIREARRTQSLAQIADRLGVSRGRVQALGK